jgi:hypothetical protein
MAAEAMQNGAPAALIERMRNHGKESSVGSASGGA